MEIQEAGYGRTVRAEPITLKREGKKCERLTVR